MSLGPFDDQIQNALQIGPPPAPSPIGTYGGEPLVREPLEDKQALLSQLGGGGMAGGMGSPGQPTGGGGFRNGAGLAIAAPLVAALLGKLSGGKVSMGEALAGLGGGFLNSKLEIQKQKKAQSIDQENRMMDLAHKSVQGLNKLSPETLAKFPKLQSLSQKYQDALANDGIISPKEAAEIVTTYEMAKADMAAAGQGQEEGLRTQQIERDATQRNQLEEKFKWENIAGGMPDAEGVGLEDKIGLAKEMAYDDQMRDRAIKDRLTPQEFNISGRSMMLSPSEGLQAIRQQETERHNLEMERLREIQSRRAGSNAGRQEAVAAYQSAQSEWQMGLQAALATVDDDPELKAQIINDFRATQPKKSDYVTGGPPSKLDSKKLDEMVGKYVGGGAGAQPSQPPSANPPGFPADGVKFGGKVYKSFAELPPEGQAKLKAHLGLK